jgi:hypothetical protein
MATGKVQLTAINSRYLLTVEALRLAHHLRNAAIGTKSPVEDRAAM